VRSPFADSPEFRRLVASDEPVELARLALEVAVDAYPNLEIEPYLQRIDQLAERVRPRCPAGASVKQVLGQINWVLYIEEEMRGNVEDYHDPRNSYLNEVLDRRLGIPISLSVLHWTIGERLGLRINGVNFPHHFMLRVDDEGQTWFIDPFHEGAVMDRTACARRLSEISQKTVVLTDDMTAGCSIKVVVTRMLRNLKLIYVSLEDIASILPVQRRLTALNPQDPSELFDLGVLCIKADRLGEAIDPLQAYLDSSPPAARAREITALLKIARRRVAESN
jgi:regulator of sirC expression with transglutaminase-like and TPR domain